MRGFMRSLIIAILALMNAYVSGGYALDDQQITKIRIIKNQTTHSTGIDRSIDGGDVSAYYINGTGQVVVNMYAIGLSYVCLVDSCGQIIDSIAVDASNQSDFVLLANGLGVFYLVIISDTFYAEGSFEII